MSPAARRVHRLTLRAPPGVGTLGAQALIVDALRTASLPGLPPGAVLRVRRLDLGVVGRGLSSMALSLRIEAALRRIAASAGRYAPGRVERAAAVWFADEDEVLVEFVNALTVDGAAGWIWPQVIEGWRPAAGPVAGVRRALRAALARGAPALAAARVVEALVAAGRTGWLVEAVAAGEGPALLAACGWSAAPVGAASVEVAAPARWRPLLREVAATWGATAPRARWLAAVAAVAARPALAAGPAAVAAGDALLAAWAAPGARTRVDDAAAPAAAAAVTAASGGGEPGVAPAVGEAAARVAAAAAAVEAASSGAPAGAAVTPVAERQTVTRLTVLDGPPPPPSGPAAVDGAPAEPAPVSFDHPVATAAAGLFFLVPVLARLGIAAFVAADPARIDLPARVLRGALHAAAVAPDDPIHAALDPALDRGEPLPFTAPAPWLRPLPGGLLEADAPIAITRRAGDAASRVLLHGDWPLALWRGAPPPLPLPMPATFAPEHPAPTDRAVAVASWLGAADRWLTAHAGLDLAACVRRPGAVRLGRWSADVVFDLRDADLRLRRRALDVDPGYVPWLGRVIHYHFVHGGRL